MTKIVKTFLTYLLVTFIILPVVLLIAVPLLILRSFAILTSKCKPGFGRPLSLTSCGFAADEIYKNPICSVVIVFQFNGPIEESHLEKQFTDLTHQNFPELKQILTRWMGFYFWKNDPNFSLFNHILFENKELNCLKDLQEEQERLVTLPFSIGKPLWEFTIYNNCNFEDGTKTVGAFKFHHSLGDGYSVIKIFNELLDDKTMLESLVKPSFPKRSFLFNVLFALQIFFLGPIHTLATLIQISNQDVWKLTPEEENQTPGYQFDMVQTSLQRVKDIAKMHGVCTSAVIFASLTGAIRYHLLESGKTIPDELYVICPLPIPSHPKNMTNHMAIVPIRAPVGEADPIRRLHKIQATYKSLQNSILIPGFVHLINFVGLVSAITQKRNKAPGTVVMTNFPGSKEIESIQGKSLTDINITAGLQQEGLAVGFASISYGSKLYWSAKVNTILFAEHLSATTFIQSVMNELQTLDNALV